MAGYAVSLEGVDMMSVRVVSGVALFIIAVWVTSVAVLRIVGSGATRFSISALWSILMAAAWAAWYMVR